MIIIWDIYMGYIYGDMGSYESLLEMFKLNLSFLMDILYTHCNIM